MDRKRIAISAAIAAGGPAAALSLLGFLGVLHWMLDLLAHFRVQYFVVLAITAGIGIAGRSWRVAAVLAALVVDLSRRDNM